MSDSVFDRNAGEWLTRAVNKDRRLGGSQAALFLTYLGDKELSSTRVLAVDQIIQKYNIPDAHTLSDSEKRKWAKVIRKELNKVDNLIKQLPDAHEAYKQTLIPLDKVLDARKQGGIPMSEETQADLDIVTDVMMGEFKLERPQGTSMHHLVDWLIQQKGKNQPMLEFWSKEFQSFIVEHDWAKAFEGVKDFEEGEIRLPYEFTCFEFRISGIRVLILLGMTDGDKIEGFIANGVNRRWYVNARRIVLENGELKHVADNFFDMVDEHYFQKWLNNFAKQIRAVCIMLDAKVAVSEKRSIGGEGLNKKRLREGKPPLRDYHVVTLAKRLRGDYEKGEPTGIRKRLHWRRGHWRHFETPRGQEQYIDAEGITRSRTWINWQLVGDERLGFVEKHYRL
jgi:hypothetical protein